MKKMWKRFVSLLLACTLLAGMLPLSASAAEKPGEGSEQYKYAESILNKLNESITNEQEKYGLYGPALLADSELYTYSLQRSIYDKDSGKWTTDTQYILVPGVDAQNTTTPNYNGLNSGQPWAESNPSAIYIAEGVTGIGNYAFASQPSLNSVVFQDASDLTYIGQRAFYEDDNAVFTDEGNGDGTTLDLSGVTTMGEYAFYNCDKLTGVELGGNITAVETVEGKVKETEHKIPNNAFNNSGLQTVTIPDGIQHIGDGAFGHTSLSKVEDLVLPDGLKTIGDNAFVVTMGSGETGIGITSLTIPSSVNSIGANAFSGRRNLAEVTVEDDNEPGTTLTLGDHAFGYNESSAYATQGSIRDEQHPEIEYSGTIGTKFFLPEDLEKYFVNEVKCYTGDITPMQYVDTEPADCINAGYDIYKTTFNGATSDGKPVELTYHYPIPALGHDYGPITEVKRTCEHDNYFEQYCERKNCPNKGVAVGSLRQNQEGPGLFDEKTNEQLSEEELNEYRLQFVKAKGHNWSVKSVVNPNMQEGQATTLYYVCENEEHRNGLDTYDSPFKIPLSGKTINALTTQSLNDLTNQLAGFSNDGMVEWAAPSDEKFGKAGEINEPVKFTIQTGVTEKWPVFTEAPEGEPNAATGENEKLTVKINVTKDVLDLSGVSIVPNTANVNKPVEVRVSGFEEAEKTGSVEYYVDGTWTDTQPGTVGEYRVRVTFEYDKDMYNLPEKGSPEYPGTGYTLVQEEDSVWVEHSFEVSLNKINAVAESISNLTYNGEKQNTLRIYGLEIGQKAVVTTTDKDGTEIKWEYTRQEGDQTTPVEGLSLLSAGTYNVKIVFSFPNHDEYAEKVQELIVHIDHKPVEKPVPTQNMSYLPVKTARDAFEGQTSTDWEFVDNETYTHTGINAGSYTAKVKLTNENYRWADESEEVREIEIPWKISPRQIVAPTLGQNYYIYQYGTWRNPLSLAESAHINYEFVTNQEDNTVKLVYIRNESDENYDSEAAVAYTATNAYHTKRKEYTITVTLNNSGNYVWWNGAPQNLTWTIGPAALALPGISAQSATYTGQPYEAKTLVTVKNDGVTLPDDVKSAGYQYSNDASFRFPSSTAPTNAGTYYVRQNYTYNNQNYNAQIPYASFTINKATAQMTFTEPKQEKTYTAGGTPLQLVEVSGLVGQDTGKEETVKKEVQYSYKYSETKVEDWSTVANSTSIKNPESQKFKEVGYYQITAKWGAGTVSNNYTATDATYTLTITQANDQKITLTSAKTNAGKWDEENNSYTTTYGSENTFTVTGQAALDDAEISYAVKDDSEKGHDGKTADVVSVDSTGEVTIKQAGEATITVTAADTDNVKGTSVEYTVTVNQAKPTVSLTDNKLEVPYTGKPITGYDIAEPTANVVEEAAPPTGAITYTFYRNEGCTEKFDDGAGGTVPIAVGTYYMKATYPGDKNYTSAESEAVTVTVTEAQLTVDAKGYTDTYDGKPHDPASITVTGVNGVISSGYTISYAKKTDGQTDAPEATSDAWKTDTQVKDVADSGDYWIKVVINGDDSSYDPYVGKEPITVTINPKPLQIKKEVTARKPYDGTKKATVEFKTINTGVDGEEINVTNIRAEYDSAEVNASSIIITYTLTEENDNTNLDNYIVSAGGEPIVGGSAEETVTQVGGTKVGIYPASITVAISNQSSVYDGSAPTVSNVKDTDWKVTDGEIYQLVPDTDDDLGITLSIDSGSKDAGAYAITGNWTNSNYTVTFTGNWTDGTAGTYTIDHRPIDVKIGDADGFYGDVPVLDNVALDDVTGDGVSDAGLVDGEVLKNVLTGLKLATTANAQSDISNEDTPYPIYAKKGEAPIQAPTQLGNYNVTFTNEGTYTVKQRPITITIADHSSVYGAEIDGGIAHPVSDKDYKVDLTKPDYTGSGGSAIVNEDVLTVTLETTASATAAAGTYDITGSAEGNKVNNYAITWAGNGGNRDDEQGQNGRYTIEEAELAISFEKGNQVVNGVSINITDNYNDNPLVLENASTSVAVSEADKATLDITYSIGAAGGGAGGVSQIAEIDKKTGEVTIHSTGTVRVTATVTAKGDSNCNYTGAQTTWYELNIISGGQMALTVTPKTNLAYTGEPQELIETPNCSLEGATIQYSLDNRDWGDEIPTETNAGTYTVYVKATDPSGQYSDVTEHVMVTISKAELEGAFKHGEKYTHVLATDGNNYDSAEKNPLTITSENYTGNADAYTYRSDNMDVAIAVNGESTIRVLGSAGQSAEITVTVPGDDNYNGKTFTYTLEISNTLSDIQYDVTGTEATYNGQPQTIAVKVTAPASGATVRYWNEEAKAYDLSEPPAYTDVKAGGYTIKFQITAPGYETVDDGTATLKINPRDISQCQVEGIAESYTFVNKPIEPQTVEVVDGSVILTKNTDYTLEYGANQEVGEDKGSVIIKGTGNYTGEVTVYFNIAPVDGSSGMTASIDPAYGTYDPDGNTATVTVTHQTGTDSHEVTLTAANAKYTISATDLVTGQAITDHGATGTGNTLTFTKPAIYDITLKLTGDHRGEFHLSYTLLPLSNEDGGLTLTVDDETQKVFTYGDEIDSSGAAITVTADGNIVTDQCTLTYVYTPFEGTPTTTASPYTAEVLKNAGVYTVTATPKDGSAITGTGTFTFLILQRDLADAILDVDDADLVFNHDEKRPSVTVTVDGNAQPTKDADYTITYYNSVNASNAAKAVVTATGNNFTGSKTEDFTIAPKPITECVVKDIPDQYYTGNEVIPPVTITDGNYTLILGYDYTTACDAIGPGTATVTIEGKGNYTGTTTKDFVIKSEGAPEPSERFDLAVRPSQWTWGDDLKDLALNVTFGTGNELDLGTEYTLEINGQTFNGTTGKTKDDALAYIKSLKPGKYTITATGVGAYNGSTDTETVTIQKIQPEVTVTATPNSLSGGGKVTLTLKGEKLPDGTDLKNLLKVTAKNDSDVTLEDLHIQWPEDGSLTAELTLPNTSETYTFTLTFTGNEYYEAATASEQVVVAQQIISGGGGGPVEDQPANPDDTGVSDWLNTKDHLAYLAGYPGGTFGPDQNMTRAEAAQMFYNLLLEKDVEITVEFVDVPEDAWYATPVNTLASLGILSGVGDGQFDPDRSITRAEFTVIAMKFANTSGGGVNIFSDVNEDDWFYSAVVDSTQYGWINGYPDGTFRPEATISRAEVTVIVNHMLGRAADRPYVIAHEEELNTFGDVNRGHWGYFHVAEATNAHEYHTEDGTESWTGLS